MNDKFNPKQYITNLRGKEYLEVKWRLVWFRADHPNGKIATEVISNDPLMLRATICSAEGSTLATGHGSAEKKAGAVWSGRELEKAETAAIGRALAHAGYGTQFTEDDEEDNLVDSPVTRKPEQKPATRQEAPKVQNAIITDAEWEAFTKLVERAQAAGVKVESYNREKLTPDVLNKISAWLKSEIEKKGSK